MKKFVDMHIHSVKSDGTYSYEEIIELIKEKNVEVFSITDHNIIPDIELLNQYAKENYLTYIPGVEIDCRFEDIIIH
ncbi:MAG: PHP domain-containing protein, partial [Oscillospiraceae bacterium]